MPIQYTDTVRGKTLAKKSIRQVRRRMSTTPPELSEQAAQKLEDGEQTDDVDSTDERRSPDQYELFAAK